MYVHGSESKKPQTTAYGRSTISSNSGTFNWFLKDKFKIRIYSGMITLWVEGTGTCRFDKKNHA